jgi:hypothetical protein
MSAKKNSVLTGMLGATGLTPDRARTGSDKNLWPVKKRQGTEQEQESKSFGTRGDRKTSAGILIQAAH